ncbi:MAG: cysteine--tRNA ligase [bacterium]|nr:cysteine--tRNA ligase [bacterium]
MSFNVYNSLSKTKEPFRPLEDGVVRMYNCGPTVYNRQHIGNFRSFLFADTLRRWLEYSGYEVRQVMNITDVGHLLDDQDEGEDKIEAQAKRTQKSPKEIADEYAQMFLEDIAQFGVLEPLARPRATEYIPEMVEMVEGLIAKGNAYQVGGDVYFDVASFPPYGRLSGNRVEDLVAGARIDVNEDKRHPADFALWKSDPRHLMKWETVFGPDGFPGWHIECSAMARKLLGDRIDVHTGGEDNVFPHHECEIAQTECFTGAPFATYWMHAKFLQVDGGKMSKSLGNVYTIDDVKEKGYDPRQLRYALIRGHYRTPLNFTWESMKGAAAELDNLDDLLALLQRAAEGADGDPGAGAELVQEAQAGFEAAMNDDLNVSQALAALLPLRRQALENAFGSEAAKDALAFLERAMAVFGIAREQDAGSDAEIDALVAARTQARADKDWAESDRIRDELAALGIEVKDTAGGATWRRK